MHESVSWGAGGFLSSTGRRYRVTLAAIDSKSSIADQTTQSGRNFIKQLRFLKAITCLFARLSCCPRVGLRATIEARLDRRAGKGLSIIEAFDNAHPRLTASQAGERCGLTRTAARRYLLTLAHLHCIATDGKLFWLTLRALRLGRSYLESARLPRIVQPFLQRITAGNSSSS